MNRTLTQDLSIKQYFMFTDYMYLNLGSYVWIPKSVAVSQLRNEY